MNDVFDWYVDMTRPSDWFGPIAWTWTVWIGYIGHYGQGHAWTWLTGMTGPFGLGQILLDYQRHKHKTDMTK